MKEMVQLFPGVTVSRPLYYAVVHNTLFTQESVTIADRDSMGLEEGNLEGDIGDAVEQWLKEKGGKSERRRETFAPSSHQWRRNENAGGSGERHNDRDWYINLKGKKRSKGEWEKHHPSWVNAEEIGVNGSTALSTDVYWGTTKILEEILELRAEQDRTIFLRDLKNGKCRDNGYENCVEGADLVRIAFQIAQFYGLTNNYLEKPRKRIFKSILDSVNKGSVPLTDSLIEHFGLESMPELMRNYHPFRKLDALVPKGDIYKIVTAMQSPELRHLKGHDFMHELGYQHIEDKGGRLVLYHKPLAKPV